jgi:hypothetical protein
MKASGVYYTVIDESITPGGSQSLHGIVVGTSTKGFTDKLNRVTSQTLKELIGYDLAYNPNLYGLKKILDSVSYVDWMRLNVDAKVGNVVILPNGDISHVADVSDPIELAALNPAPLFYVTNKFPGDWGPFVVQFKPVIRKIEGSLVGIVLPNTWTFTGRLGFKESFQEVIPGVFMYTGFKIMNAEGTQLLAFIEAQDETFLSDNMDLRNLNGDIVGTLSYDSGLDITSIEITEDLGAARFVVSYVTSDYLDWTLSLYEKKRNALSFKESHEVSFSPSSGNFIGLKPFGDLLIGCNASLPLEWDTVWSQMRQELPIQEGTNGRAPLSASEINLTLLDFSPANIVVMNGTISLPIINAFLMLFVYP